MVNLPNKGLSLILWGEGDEVLEVFLFGKI
jgi:hypothetical protein